VRILLADHLMFVAGPFIFYNIVQLACLDRSWRHFAHNRCLRELRSFG